MDRFFAIMGRNDAIIVLDHAAPVLLVVGDKDFVGFGPGEFPLDPDGIECFSFA